MRQTTKKIDKVAVALILCFSVVALASVFTVKASIDKLNLSQKENINIGDAAATPEDRDVIRPVPTVDSKDSANAQNPVGPEDFTAPLSGKILAPYSADAPIYSTTLDQYMIHESVDIASVLDTQVKAVAAGTVTKVWNDDKYGISIEVSHGNGLSSIYANLSTDKMVEVGDTVKQGQAISGVGESALFESLDGAHLHFSMKKDGQPVDPGAYMKLGE